MSWSKTISLHDADATLALGASLAPLLAAGDCLCLYGNLGAGKTTLSRGLIGALTGAEEVPSPTFTLVQTYEADAVDIWHFDLYRLDGPEALVELGFDEALDEGVSLIEWPERLAHYKPATALDIHLTFDGDGRQVRFSGHRSWEARLEQL